METYTSNAVLDDGVEKLVVRVGFSRHFDSFSDDSGCCVDVMWSTQSM